MTRDVYSDLKVPFDVGTWCRGHLFNVTAVNIARDVRALKQLRANIEHLEQQETELELRLSTFIDDARKKMENGNGL